MYHGSEPTPHRHGQGLLGILGLAKREEKEGKVLAWESRHEAKLIGGGKVLQCAIQALTKEGDHLF